jgi:hypothetical protein
MLFTEFRDSKRSSQIQSVWAQPYAALKQVHFSTAQKYEGIHFKESTPTYYKAEPKLFYQ